MFRRINIKDNRSIDMLIREWEEKMAERQPIPEEEALLREIKKGIAKKADE
ncbi:MAG: hypothetical protein F7C81_03220 [Desulfurococcales archaeon]|nr:hypothetical protein [Desulfurococcales archaeon]MEB3779467.1 hypothetical protein [Desulfurococcales archaeon]